MRHPGSDPRVDDLTVLLVPGMGCDGSVFGPLFEQLTCVESVSPVVGDVHLGSTVADIAERVLASAPDPFLLVGFSMGGYVAMEVALARPDRVLGLVLIGSSARADPPGLEQMRRDSERRAENGEFEAVAAMTAEALVGPAVSGRGRLVNEVREMMLAVGPDAYVRHSHAVRTRSDRRGQIGDLDVPFLALGGEFDTAVPAKLSHEMAELVPDGTAETIRGGGHMLPLENPSEVFAGISRIIELVIP